jgi:hypothetical protein
VRLRMGRQVQQSQADQAAQCEASSELTRLGQGR